MDRNNMYERGNAVVVATTQTLPDTDSITRDTVAARATLHPKTVQEVAKAEKAPKPKKVPGPKKNGEVQIKRGKVDERLLTELAKLGYRPGDPEVDIIDPKWEIVINNPKEP